MTRSDPHTQPLIGSVSRRLASRPTLAQIIGDLLRSRLGQAIKEPVAPDHLALARGLWRTRQGQAVFSGYTYEPLVDTVYRRHLTNTPLQLSPENDFLTDQGGSEYPRHLTADLSMVGQEIDLAGRFFLEAWSDRMTCFWSEPGADGQTPWAWLAEHVRQLASRSLRTASAFGQMSAPQVALVDQQLAASGAEAHPIEAASQAKSRVVHAEGKPLPLLLVEGDTPRPFWMVFDPQQGWARFGTVAALAGYLGQASSGAAPFDLKGVPGQEALPGLDLCSVWAGAVLADYLRTQRSLAARLQAERVDTATFEAAMNAFPAAALIDRAGRQVRIQAIRQRLPQWLGSASDSDQLRYGLGLQQVVHAQQTLGSSGFLSGIPTVEQYARDRLTRQIAREHPDALLNDVEDVQITVYSRTDDDLLSIAGGGGTITYDERQLGLIDLSLLNTGGRPAGWMKVSARPGKVVPAWLDDTSVLALVKQVDVGGSYLKLLRNAFTVGTEGQQRRMAFKIMVAAQLPLLALETKLREDGFDERGVALVRRVCEPQGVRPAPAVARLALEATAGAAPDQVTGMFVLWAPEKSEGPVVLYAPLGPVPLRQFKSRASLMQAIIEEPQLQQAVLAWLSDTAAPKYRNGGLRAPHWLRFGLGSEFAPEPAVGPARLVTVEVTGAPLDAFYDGVVEAITVAADRQTISTEESFWRSARQLSWLLFNQLVPLFSGVAASAAWLVQLGHALSDHFNSVGPSGEAEAFDNEELVLDLALALLTAGVDGSLADARAEIPHTAVGEGVGEPVPVAPVPQFSWASPRASLTAQMRRRLSDLAVTVTGTLPPQVSTGPFRGLIHDGRRWVAHVGGQWFEVTPGDGEARVVNVADRAAPGPWLRRDDVGNWRFDLRLRLHGGAPKRRIEQQRELNEQLRAQANQYLQQIQQTYQQMRARGTEGDQAIIDAIQANDLATARARRAQEQQRLEEAFQASLRLRTAYEGIGKKIALADYAKHLSTALAAEVNMCGYYLAMTREALVDSLQANEAMAIHGQDTGEMTAEQARHWFAFLHQQADGAAAAERWRGWLEERLNQLRDIPVFGPRVLEQLKPRFSSFRSQVEYQVLRSYIQLSLLEEPMQNDQPARDALHEAMTPLSLGLNTHRALAAGAGVSEVQEGELLDGVIATYQAAEDTVQWLRQTLQPEYLSTQMDQLVELIAALQQKAEAQLSNLMKTERPGPSAGNASPPVAGASAGGQRVIRTRNRGPLMARVRKLPERPAQEIAEVVSPLNDSVVARFSQDPQQGDWVQEVVPRPEPERGSASRADVDRLMTEADRRLASGARQLEQAPRLAQVTRIPVELEEMLCGAARDLLGTADRIEQALTRLNETDVAGPGYPSAELKARALRDMSLRLTQEGRRLRISLTKTALPTAARVRYLIEQNQATIRRLGGRVALKGKGKRKDIVQEYVIEEVGGPTLWYAHFHYSSVDAPDSQYLAAHLKTVTQRFVGLNTQMAQAATNAEVVKIYRSRIDPGTARELFLSQH